MGAGGGEPLEEILRGLSGRARGVLVAAGAHIAEADRPDDEALRAALRARGLPEPEALFAFHRAAGGLAAPGLSLTFAPARRAATKPALVTPTGDLALPVGYSAGAAYYLDASGVIYRSRAAPRDRELVAVAVGPRALLEKLAFVTEAEAAGALRLRVRPRVGAAMAAALSVRAEEEVSDSFHQAWIGDDLWVLDGDPFQDDGAGDTLVWARSLDACIAALRAAGAAGQVTAAVTARERALQIEPPHRAPPAPDPGALEASGALPLLDDEGSSGHVWEASGPPRIEQTRELAGAVLCWKSFNERGAAVTDYTGASAALEPLLTGRAVRGLVRLRARMDPRRSTGREELSRLLSRWGFAPHEPVFDLEARCGGLHFDDLRWGTSWILGGWPEPESAGDASAEPEELVPIGESTNSNVKYSMDAEGTVYLEDDDVEPTPIAASWLTCLERLGASSADAVERLLTMRVRARVGSTLAAALGVPPVPEGTDEYASMWYREEISLLEEAKGAYDGAERTTVAASSEETLVMAMRAALEGAPGAPMAVFGVQAKTSPPPAGAPLLIRARLWGEPWDPREREIVVHGGPDEYWFVWT